MSTARGDDAAPRTIITTDPELDDLNSMLRLLLYSNEIDIVGLVYSSSQFHYAGDAAEGRPPFRWPAPGAVFHIDQAVDAYARVHHNLVVHDDRYPTPEHLRSLIAWGNVADVGDMAADTPGSDLIRRILLDDESFGHQDHTFADYIRPSWPALESREVATRVWGYFARTVIADEDQHLLTAEWTRRNVTAVGPLGAEYRVWGDGKQMADGFDAEDYFGLSGLSADELAAQGYEVWMPPRPRGQRAGADGGRGRRRQTDGGDLGSGSRSDNGVRA